MLNEERDQGEHPAKQAGWSERDALAMDVILCVGLVCHVAGYN